MLSDLTVDLRRHRAVWLVSVSTSSAGTWKNLDLIFDLSFFLPSVGDEYSSSDKSYSYKYLGGTWHGRFCRVFAVCQS